MNTALTRTQTSDALAIRAEAGGGSMILPQSFTEVMEFATAMSKASVAVPVHLRNDPGACLAVTMQAMQWNMNPFSVAQKSYRVGQNTLAYEAQLISAVINMRAGLKRRPTIDYRGEGQTRQCIVTLEFLDGSTHSVESPMLKDITVKNSPLWKSDPDQQLAYYTTRTAGRRHCPEVILGVYDREEAVEIERDVTPAQPAITGVSQRLAAVGAPQSSTSIIEHTAAEIDAPEIEQKQATEPQTHDDADRPSSPPYEPPYDPERLNNYASALWRCETVEALEAAHNAFFEGDADQPDPRSRATAWSKVFETHRWRIVKQKPEPEVQRMLDKALAEYAPS